jgi:hypothetical protein
VIVVTTSWLVYSQDHTLTVVNLQTADRHHVEVPPWERENVDFAVFVTRTSLRVVLPIDTDAQRVVWVYDPKDNRFGYAFHLDSPGHSGWGHAPLPARVRRPLRARLGRSWFRGWRGLVTTLVRSPD